MKLKISVINTVGVYFLLTDYCVCDGYIHGGHGGIHSHSEPQEDGSIVIFNIYVQS